MDSARPGPSITRSASLTLALLVLTTIPLHWYVGPTDGMNRAILLGVITLLLLAALGSAVVTIRLIRARRP